MLRDILCAPRPISNTYPLTRALLHGTQASHSSVLLRQRPFRSTPVRPAQPHRLPPLPLPRLRPPPNQALSLLHALSSADDSQRAALRTPRVLHAALTFCAPDAAAQGLHCEHQASPAAAATASGAMPLFGAITTRSPGRTAATNAAPATGPRAQWPLPSVAASAAARMLLAELLPPRSGDGISSDITAAFAAASVSGAGAGGMVGGAAGVARGAGWTGGAGGQRWARHAAAGAWCSGLEFDRAAGGGVP